MNESTLIKWECTVTTCQFTFRSAPCDPHSCAGHLIDARDFKAQAREINSAEETEWK